MNTLFTPTTATAVMASAASLGLIGTLLLIGFLVKRVLFEGIDDGRAQRLVDGVTIVIAPLFIVFGLTVFFKIGDMLR